MNGHERHCRNCEHFIAGTFEGSDGRNVRLNKCRRATRFRFRLATELSARDCPDYRLAEHLRDKETGLCAG